MADLEAEYRLTLKNDIAARKRRNPRFSLRSYARILKCDATYLSKLVTGKLILSVDMAGQFADRLKLNSSDRQTFIVSAAEEQKCHALYLLDPTLTDCLVNEVSARPQRRLTK